MTRAIAPLSMSTIDELPEPCRSCVHWEVGAPPVDPAPADDPEDPDAPAASRDPFADDGAFEKEVWLSGVTLTWGSAGAILSVDDRPTGFALFAPPTTVTRAAAFPTSPVSPDAVLLTSLRVLPEVRGQGLGRALVAWVTAELTRRGVRALEAFGVEEATGRRGRRRPLPADAGCMLPAGFLRSVGFTEVRPHPVFPRLRMELETGLGWKAQVEAALEKLVTVITVPAAPARDRELVPAP
ncbi:GNAT family N-acetyltransferase [Nakamurella endophytica]|uniref:N-acetyltransferase domain-containing protein n=1 Tax=Nakamurella endophytica TaxID=1748367 RepID=A0A917WEX2_9ACTN|nr:GNAT family N-acetyltransferase [Nakamurella endophytica]GGL97020.1 hypothetical protein GCM10011594_15910 [Nakamurella endophytica]